MPNRSESSARQLNGPAMIQRYMTPRQVAELLQVNEKTVRIMVLRGEIAAIRLRGPRSAIRISEGALADFLWSRRSASS
ncbi:helix-turn-helix domain-containing protein [Nakamurella panacisegetis]|uniref:helix-turn-helix domain-containing protein n=1 Tax=Nakamurella panacisegetis TaxID=1090615 RepID=UPI000B886A96